MWLEVTYSFRLLFIPPFTCEDDPLVDYGWGLTICRGAISTHSFPHCLVWGFKLIKNGPITSLDIFTT